MAPRTPKDTEKKPSKDAKSAKAKAVPVAEPEAAPAAETAVGQVKLKEIIDSVATRTGSKKHEVKSTVEATLAVLREALATGKAMALPPLGKLRVVKAKGAALTLKLRLAEGTKAEGFALADDGEDG